MPVSPTRLKNFTDSPLPEVIYFDTSFVIRTLVDGESHSNQCREFIKRLKEKQLSIVFSNFLRAELWHARLFTIFKQFEKKKHINFSNCCKKYQKKLNTTKNFYSEIKKINERFNELLQNFEEWVESPMENKIIKLALDIKGKYNLHSYDAIHIATMLDWGIKDIVTFDGHIEDITDLNIWTNDGIRRYKRRHNL